MVYFCVLTFLFPIPFWKKKLFLSSNILKTYMYIYVIVKALIRVFLYDRHVVTFWQEMQFVQGHVTLLLVKQQFLEELVAMNFQRSLSTWSMVKGLKYMHFCFFMFIIVIWLLNCPLIVIDLSTKFKGHCA